MNLGWLKDLTKPFSTTLNAVAERLALRIGRRKPNLYVHFDPVQTVWCIAQSAQRGGSPVEYMHVVFWADLNHDDPKQTLVIVNAYPEGTQPEMETISKFSIPPGSIVHEQLSAIVLPFVAKKGEPWIGKFILVDQFDRTYKTKKIKFKWVGPVENRVP
jgi:hypothetical protein